MNNQIKGRRKATSQKEEKATTRVLWLFWEAHHNWFVSQDSDAFASQGPKEEFRRKPMQKVMNAIQRVRFTRRHASIWDKKGPSLGQIQVKLRHQRSPYSLIFEDRSHEKTERLQRCARSEAWNLSKNIFKLEEKDKAAFYFHRRNGYSWLRQQKSRRKESL